MYQKIFFTSTTVSFFSKKFTQNFFGAIFRILDFFVMDIYFFKNFSWIQHTKLHKTTNFQMIWPKLASSTSIYTKYYPKKEICKITS